MAAAPPAAPAQLTWDITPPRRPSLADVGGATLADHAAKPPNKETMPYADELNQWAKQIERLATMIGSFGVSVTFGGSGPVVSQYTAMRTTVLNATFTVVPNGTGDTTISWPVNTFPTSVLGPMHALNDGVVGGGITSALTGAESIRVKTWTGAATPADRPFTVVVR